jgi:hypothetical protein
MDYSKIFFDFDFDLFIFFKESISEENLFFIVSPKDVVVARLRDMDDHITWLMEHERYEANIFLLFFP